MTRSSPMVGYQSKQTRRSGEGRNPQTGYKRRYKNAMLLAPHSSHIDPPPNAWGRGYRRGDRCTVPNSSFRDGGLFSISIGHGYVSFCTPCERLQSSSTMHLLRGRELSVLLGPVNNPRAEMMVCITNSIPDAKSDLNEHVGCKAWDWRNYERGRGRGAHLL